MPAGEDVDVVRSRTKDEFADELNARPKAGYKLWPLLEDGSVIIETNSQMERDLCGKLYGPPGRAHSAVIARIHKDSGEDGAFLTYGGASVREVLDMIRKRDRVRSRLEKALAGELDEDAMELRRVVDALDDRLQYRTDFDTSFSGEWVPKVAVACVYARDESAADGLPGFDESHSVEVS